MYVCVRVRACRVCDTDAYDAETRVVFGEFGVRKYITCSNRPLSSIRIKIHASHGTNLSSFFFHTVHKKLFAMYNCKSEFDYCTSNKYTKRKLNAA